MEDIESIYTIRPPFHKKFNPPAVKEILRLLLIEELGDKWYFSIDPAEKAKSMTEMILNKMKEMPYEGYRYVVQVVIAEQRGQGLKMSSLSMWDADTDNCASEFFCTDQIICIATVFAVYYY